jgi:radical SAM superfamily enzyme YgiQ (UPF0313 family)
VESGCDLLLINPGGRKAVYQDLGANLTAIEPPQWCRLIAGYALDRGWRTRILDSEAEELEPEAVAERVAALAPRLAVVTVFGHQPSASTQSMPGAGEVCRAIKARIPELPVMLVGGHVSALPERTLHEEVADFACKGEGPVTVVRLLEEISGGFPDLAAVPGLVWRGNAGPVVNQPARLIEDLDADLHGDAWHLLPMDRYRAHNWHCFGLGGSRQPYASIYTSLGCPYRCSFCCINAPFDSNRYRMRSPAAVVAEVDKLHRLYGVSHIKIVDEMFVLNDRHVTAICEGLAALPYAATLNIWAYARIDTVREQRLALLRRAGFRWLALGIESGSAHVREGADKAFEESDIAAVVRAIQQAGINVIGNFIFGLPDDDLASMRQTLALAQSLNCEFANFYVAMAYPGSALYRTAAALDLELPESWSGYAQHSYDCRPLPTAHLSAAEILAFRDEAFHAYFGSRRYLEMLSQRLGQEARAEVEGMSSRRLRRLLLDQRAA